MFRLVGLRKATKKFAEKASKSATSGDIKNATPASVSTITAAAATNTPIVDQSKTFFIPTPTGVEAAAAATSSSTFTSLDSAAATISKFSNVGKLILLRNGEHAANVDRSVYCATPDWKIQLTEKGIQQSLDAGNDIARLTNGDPVFVYFSPYLRSYATMQAMLTAGANPKPAVTSLASSSALSSTAVFHPPPPPLNIIGVREDSRLRDGDIGRYDGGVEELDRCLAERQSYGSFFYRFPHGESGADVCDRVSSFLDAFHREQMHFPPKTNVVLVTHGLTIRMFVKRWFHLNVSTFHDMTSPPPGKAIELESQSLGGKEPTSTAAPSDGCPSSPSPPNRFRLTDASVEMLSLPKSLTENNGYAYRQKRVYGSISTGAPYV